MTLNGSGIRDISRVLKISPNTVLHLLRSCLLYIEKVNLNFLNEVNGEEIEVICCRADEVEGLNVEMDEMWNYVKNKANLHWLCYGIDHKSGKVLAYLFAKRKDEPLLRLKDLLKPFGITGYFTDNWGLIKGT